MPNDLYDLPLTTASPAACDAYVEATRLALTFYPGALAAYDRAIAADPAFALAHAGRAQVLLRQGDVAATRASLTTARELTASASEREASHVAFLERVFAGETDAALAALYAHLDAWPRDALVVATASNPNGLIGGSGQLGQKKQVASLMDRLAPAYGDDPWFASYHALALAEDGQFARARALAERSLAARRDNAHGAHAFAHVCYETGDLAAARAFLPGWLADYPRDGFFHGHLSWHLALCEILAGNAAEAGRLYRDAIAPDRHSGGPQQKISDGAAFLWRSELAGHPRDTAAWRALHEHALAALPRPGNGLYDLHVILAQAVMGDAARGEAAAPDARARQIEALAREGRYLSGDYLPALARGFLAFERGDDDAAIEALSPLAGQNERIGGSRAQHDLIDFTLLGACLRANRLDEARRLLEARRPDAAGPPVTGLEAALGGASSG
ncbi:tetratricopeptide repeat protein [Reyranella sp.]|uniref:tetratricopeptide repeat protein n=1 Tax=Reyranella sp. TaxID=1929291 RepID=UPI003BAD9472